jgi:hypothetical protein
MDIAVSTLLKNKLEGGRGSYAPHVITRQAQKACGAESSLPPQSIH